MDDDATRALDLAQAWPEDDDLTLSGSDTETLQEVYNEPETDQPNLGGDDTTAGQASDTERGEHTEDPDGQGLPNGDKLREEPSEEQQPDSRSPVSWNAGAREHWKDIPKAAQDYILQRENQMQAGMQKNAETAQRAHSMDRALQPYQQYFQMNGGAGRTIQNLLQTGAGLQMGSPQQKAQLVANIISQYGVDITALDNLITGGEVPPEMQQQGQFQEMLDQRLGPLQQQLAQYQQRDQQFATEQQNEAGGEVTTFAQDVKNEFYNDVRGDMADILDMAANRGVIMSLQDAYTRACALNPEIARIEQSRQQQKTLQGKRRAAASVSGSMGGPGDSAPSDSMRGAIEDAWDNVGRA